MIAMPISLDQVDKRKQTILTECDKVLKNKYNACTPVTNIIAVNANVEALQTLINRFGSVSMLCIDAPVLLSLINDGKNGKVRVTFDAEMKVKLILNTEEKEEKEEWNEKRICDNPSSNEFAVCVTQIGSYQFTVPLEVVDEIGIISVRNRILNPFQLNETKLLHCGEITSNVTLTTTPCGHVTMEWNKVVLRIQTLLILNQIQRDLKLMDCDIKEGKQNKKKGLEQTKAGAHHILRWSRSVQ